MPQPPSEPSAVGPAPEDVGERLFELRKRLADMEGQCRALFRAKEEAENTREEQVRALERELAAAQRELDLFCFSVSHDFRSPLRAIEGFSAALLEDWADALDDRARNYLRRVQSAGQTLSRLMDDLLKVAHLARCDMYRTEVDLSGLAGQIVDEIRATQPDRQVHFLIAPGLKAKGDPRLFYTVFYNLLENAWKFTAGRARARIQLAVTRQKGKPILCVRDDGVGFNMAYADKLFGMFQRLHGTGEFGGNGVGLACVQRIIHRCGGSVWAEGRAGRGARIYFTLPDLRVETPAGWFEREVLGLRSA
jgi:light-regulated signal transduction histidine kinase (bacteriophytochrome)